MIQHIQAIYDHGVFRPLGPLELGDQTVVSLSIEEVKADGAAPATDKEAARRIIGLLADEPELVDFILETVAERRSRPLRIQP